MRDPSSELAAMEASGLRRSLRTLQGPQAPEVRLNGRTVVNFSSNDYLGLANAEVVKAALQQAVAVHGAGAGASRLVSGTLSPHSELEAALARLKGTEAALCFSSGYAAAVGTLTALLRPGDIVILDKLCHASLVDGAKLSGATIRVFPHNHMEKLARLLDWAVRMAGVDGRTLVVTESVFSMDGDWADLPEIVRLKEACGAWLLVDEAHAFGILGKGGRGLANKLALAARIDLHLGTLSKAAGLSGGFVCSRRDVIDLLANRARSFVYSTAPPPALAAAACAVVERILPTSIGDRRRHLLWQRVEAFVHAMGGTIHAAESAILPLIIGDEAAAVECSTKLLEQGFLVPAIRYPTVARGKARLRVTFSADHAESQVGALAAALQRAGISGRTPVG